MREKGVSVGELRIPLPARSAWPSAGALPPHSVPQYAQCYVSVLDNATHYALIHQTRNMVVVADGREDPLLVRRRPGAHGPAPLLVFGRLGDSRGAGLPGGVF